MRLCKTNPNLPRLTREAPTSPQGRTCKTNPPPRRGAVSVEYMLVLGLVVIPLAAMLPLFIRMIQQYAERVSSLMRLPFP
jgi:hypothetical protein